MLLRCGRCLSKFAHDLLHCPQCGIEADGNSSPDPDVVGDTPNPEAVAAVAPAKKSRAKATAAAPAETPTPAPDVPATEQGS